MTIEDIEVGVEYDIVRMLENQQQRQYTTFNNWDGIMSVLAPMATNETFTGEQLILAVNLYHNMVIKSLEQQARSMLYANEQSPVEPEVDADEVDDTGTSGSMNISMEDVMSIMGNMSK